MSLISEITSSSWLFGLLLSLIFIFNTIAFLYILKKQYRFATILFDMLPYYPYFLLVNGAIGIYPIFLFSISQIMKVTYGIITLSISVGLYYKFAQWYKSYHFSRYELLLKKLKAESSVEILSWGNWKQNPQINPEKISVLIRHDVDIFLKRAKRMFELEKDLGIPTCYLFRNNAEKYTFEEALNLINNIKQDSTFEIGFHYETIANAKGDLIKASELFKTELEQLRNHFEVNFIAAHGDKYRNRRLKEEGLIDLSNLGLISAYDLPFDSYISDAGGLRTYTVGDKKAAFIDNLEIIFSMEKGTLVQVLLHSDWWY
jgi:hypothetical protein